MLMEIWKDITGYEGMYQISNGGSVKSLSRYRRSSYPKILKPGLGGVGYLTVNLSKNNRKKVCAIHRLVGENFLDNPLGKKQINHINGIKTDNRVENLEWVTNKENAEHAHRTGLIGSQKGELGGNHRLTEKQVRLIKHLFNCKPKMTYKEIGKIFNIGARNIGNIREGKNWKHVIV